MEKLLYPRYDEMADRLVDRFPEVPREQAEGARDLVRAINPNYYDRRSKVRSTSGSPAAVDGGRLPGK